MKSHQPGVERTWNITSKVYYNKSIQWTEWNCLSKSIPSSGTYSSGHKHYAWHLYRLKSDRKIQCEGNVRDVSYEWSISMQIFWQNRVNDDLCSRMINRDGSINMGKKRCEKHYHIWTHFFFFTRYSIKEYMCVSFNRLTDHQSRKIFFHIRWQSSFALV